jgi:hypothetical protein
METIPGDVRYAAGRRIRNPGSTAGAFLTLALRHRDPVTPLVWE